MTFLFSKPYGEIDPLFIHSFGEKLFYDWLVYTDTHEHALTWNGQMDKPLIVEGWTEIQEFYNLQYKHHEVEFIYYGDGKFLLKVDVEREMDRRFFPEYHSVSILDHDLLTFRVVVSGLNTGNPQLTLVFPSIYYFDFLYPKK